MANFDFNQQALQSMRDACLPLYEQGETASYIPILQQVNPAQLGICVATKDGRHINAGEYDQLFSMQSIVKVIIFACALLDNDAETISKKVSVEPTNDGFNSIRNLEIKNDNKPLNPMINAGAIACTSLIHGASAQEKTDRILLLVRQMAGSDTIRVNTEIFQSEKQTGYRNRALAYYMQSTGILSPHQDMEELLDTYFQACSIAVTCADLANIALVLACNGRNPVSREKIFSKQIARVLKATMVMCGMYNESGRVAVQIGLPTKSGVGGGILSVIPNKMGIGIFGPALNETGSSVAGLALLGEVSRTLDASIF